MAASPRRPIPFVRLVLLGIAFAMALLSCGRDVTSPNAVARFARGIAWRTEFPPAYQLAGGAAAGVADFNRVHVVLHHADGTVALDTVIDFPAGADSITVSLDVKLLPSAPESGEPLSLNLGYINAAGDTVFKGGPVTVTAAPSSPGSPPPPAVTIPVSYTGPGANAVGVQISPRSGTVASGGSFTFSAIAVDQSGAPVPNTPIIWNSLDPSIASVPSAASGTAVAGITRGTARIVAQLLTGPADQVTLSVVPPPSAIAVSSGSGQSAIVGATLPGPLVAIVTAADGLAVSGITVNFAVTSGGGSVGSASAVTNSSGLAQTTWKLGSTVGTQTVTASTGSIPGSSATFSATAKSAAATQLSVTSQPSSTTAGASIAPVTIVALTATGDTASSFTGAVSLSLSGGAAGATLGGSSTVNAVAGVAIFSGLQITKSGTGYALTAGSSGLGSAATSSFDITAGPASKLGFNTQPSSTTVGTPIGTVVVAATDQFGNTAAGFTGLVTVALSSNPTGATLGGTTSANAVAGIATIGPLTVSRAGTGYALSASASGLAGATSAAFNSLPGGAAAILVAAGAGQSAPASTVLPSPITVAVQDLGGTPVAGVAVAFAVVSGGGTVSVTNAVTDAGGFATTVWTLGATAGTQSISATSTGLAGSPLTINATATVTLPHFTFTTSPAVSQTAGVALSPNVVVQARDATNALIPGFTGAVSMAIGTNPGGGTLSGTVSVNAVGGIATFSTLSIDKAGVGYTLTASAAGYTTGGSTGFNIGAAAATTMVKSAGDAQTAGASPLRPTPLAVLVTDAFGNAVSGRTISWAAVTGGGSVGSPTSVTNASGIATIAWTLGATLGGQSVSATSAGLAGSPLTFTATASSGTVATTTVAPHTTTMTSIGDVFTLTATARDAGNNIVAGTYAWVSRTPGVATVNAATGVVTAVTNGTAYVVATETGGTKDSALVTVAQIVATINVTPSSSNVYLGASRTFTAQAVDGHSNPLAIQPAFTWSSTVPSVATVSGAGVATGVSLGSTQIRATSGAIIGTASLVVNTIIQHIYVARDSATFSQTANDAFNMGALQLHRSYKAFAYDTLNNPVTGLTFAWNSSNPAVATIDSSGPVTARALSVANGTASISASVQGVTGAATLNVAQVLASIAVTPASPSVAVAGSLPMIAHGKDSNGQSISGGAFVWTSSAPSIATINSASGVVTGVALGTTNVVATIGAIASTPDVVTVSASVPPTISFGRDTVSVGRGSNTQVPILLSTPSASPVIVNLAVADTFAFWSTASVTIPAGQTSVNAQLNGHNAGTTHITATDQASVYASTTSVLAVQATMRLTTGSYAVNATDQQTTQVLLSDPSPVGGTFVTFNYGTGGIASVSPSPAFIPSGQLAATIVITGTAAGTTTVTPVAIGVNGNSSSFTTYAPTLTFNTSSLRLGAGQFDAGEYVYLPTYAVTPLAVTFTSSNPAIATVTGSGTITSGNYTFQPTISGVAPGTVTITASASGWTSATMTVVVTTPHIYICCGTGLNTTSPAQTYIVESEDSVGTAHYRSSSLVVHVHSSNPAVLTVVDSVVTIAPGAYYNNAPQVVPGGTGGTAWLIATAGGHTADSTLYTVVGPKLQFSWTNNRLGLGQEDDNVYVYSPNTVVTPLTITLSGDTTITGFPATVTIPAGTNIGYFNVRGKAFGSVPIIATAAGYQADTATYTVTTPKVKLFGGGSLNNFAAPSAFTVEAYDSTGTAHNRTTPLVVTFTSTNTSVITVDPTVTIAAGIYYANTQQVTPVGTGTAMVIATAAGHTADTLTYTIVTPQLNLAFSTYTIGALEHRLPTDFYAYTPNNRTTPLTVTLTDNHPAVAGLSTNTVTINAGTNIGYFTFSGLTPGLDTVTATAPGYLPTVAYIRVTTPKLIGGGLPGSATTTNPPITVTLETADSVGSALYATDTVVVHAVSSIISVLQPAQAYFPILKNNYYAQSTINVVGPGTASITYSDSAGLGFQPITSNTMTVTGPSLAISSANFVLGNRQNTGVNGVYVYTPNNVASPLVVTLTSTDPTVAIPTVSTVTIPTNSNIAYFQINALDATGTIQIQATATGYGGISTTVQVTVPKFVIFTNSSANTTAAPQSVTVEAYDNGASPQAHYTNENVTITLASSAPSVATTDTATITILAGNYYHNTSHWIPGAVGTTQLSATDTRPQSYHYNTAIANVTVNTPALTLNNFNQLGIGQYSDSYFYVQAPDVATAPITVTLTHPGTVRATTPATVTIPTSSTFTYFRVIGAAIGTDTIVASATSPVFNPATAFIVVGNGRLDPLSGWPGSSMHVGDSVAVTIVARDPAQTQRNVIAATTFTLAPDSHVEFHSAGAVVTSATIPANATSVVVYLKAIAQGSGSTSISAANYTTYTNSVTVIP